MRVMAIVGLLALFGANAQAAERMRPAQIGELGARTLALWECAVFASLADDKPEHARLFTAGLAEGRRLYAEISSRRDHRNDAEANAVFNKLPMIVGFNLGGPSSDFALGNLWGHVEQYAADQATGKRENAKELATGELLRLRAAELFHEGNCRLLR